MARVVILLLLVAALGWWWTRSDSERSAHPTRPDDVGPAGNVAARSATDPVDEELNRLRALPAEREAEALSHYERLLREIQDATRRSAVACELAVRVNNRATRLARAGDRRGADADSKHAVGLCPTDAQLKQNRANILFSFAMAEDRKTGDGRRVARELAEQGLLLEDSANAHVLLGEIAWTEDDVNQAVQHYQKAVALQPTPQWQTRLQELQQKANVEGGFSDRKHDHFVARFEGYAQEQLAWLALDELEKAYFSVGRALDLYPKEPITVIIYTGDQYARATNVPDWTTGLFDGKIRVAQGQLALQKGQLEGVLRHEYTHAALATLQTPIPTWMNEGLAEHFEGTDGEAAQRRCAQAAADGHRITWAELNGPFVSITDADRAGLAYATSTALVAALVESRGAYALVTFVTHLESGEAFDEAFTGTFALSPAAHFERWQAGL